MSTRAEETEAKFYVKHLAALPHRILEAGGQLGSPRVLEHNLRYDTPGKEFRRTGQVLRLRRDRRARLTYKDGGRLVDGIFHRKEIEFEVLDFEAADQFLQALGYEIVFRYEKYRTTYDLNGMEVVLDELPIGDFVEIEGAPLGLRPLATMLGLNWAAAVLYSYYDLFEQLRLARSLPFHDLTFENFANLAIAPEDLKVAPADA